MKRRRMGKFAVALAAALALASPSPANAAFTGTADDPNESNIEDVWDIKTLAASFDNDTITITTTLYGAAKPLSDAGWASEKADRDGRVLMLGLTDYAVGDVFDGIALDADGAQTISLHGTDTCSVTSSITGDTISVTAPQSCFRNLGKLNVSAYLYDSASDTYDVAIADGDGDLSTVLAERDGGYYLVASDGGVFSMGSLAKFHGSMGGKPLNAPMVGMATAGSDGYWTVAADGGIFTYGDNDFYGSMGGKNLNAPMVSMAPTKTGKGYWTVASDGGIFSYGDAQFYGSTGSLKLNKPVVGMSVTPSGEGYWLVAADGGIFAFGDAQFYGSTGNITLNKPIVGMATAPGADGYWMVASDGGVFSYGAGATFHGAAGDAPWASFDSTKPATNPVAGMIRGGSSGYYLYNTAGEVNNFGSSAPDFGDFYRLAGELPNKPIVGGAVAAGTWN